MFRSVGYDAATKNLEIEFQTGLVYQYAGVPEKSYKELMKSEAIGKYFTDKIRSRFRTKQIVT